VGGGSRVEKEASKHKFLHELETFIKDERIKVGIQWFHRQCFENL